MKIAVIGGVNSTRVLIHSLAKHGYTNCRVWGYVPSDSSSVSGWCDLRAASAALNMSFQPFRKVAECENKLRAFAPDILFVVGLSQIVPTSMLGISRIGNIGFHPTALPRGRGRAAIAWMILHRTDGAASFFELRGGVDDGPIIVQETFRVNDTDDAATVEAKILEAEARALDKWLPTLRENGIVGIEQDHKQATWLGRRTQDDGWLNWSQPREEILALIRASAPPHPGAFTYYNDTRIEITAARVCDRPETGVTGRIVAVYNDRGFDVQCGDALITIKRWQGSHSWQPRVGMKLGYYVEVEVFKLLSLVKNLEQRIETLEHDIERLQQGT
ncbi:methionyl-tRNA formyltransferase [Pararhodobacter oceanensis]|nr:formyltransferase family protein [Pararhodobacter oceanensis]